MKSFSEFINEGKALSPAEEARLKKRDELKSKGKISTGDFRSTAKDTKGERPSPLQLAKKRNEMTEGVGEVVKKVKTEYGKYRKFGKASGEAVDRLQRMNQHKQDKYGPSTFKQRLKTGAEHNTDNERKARNEDWQKKSGKNPEGGLNEKGRKSYERENPGSDLKAPSKKVGNPRRASFCARMSGMKKKLTSKKTANDPDSRINKSLRAWNC